MQYDNEVALRESMGLQSWRNLSKDNVFDLIRKLPDTNPEVALQLLGQMPEISSLARATLDDTTRAYEAAISSNARNQDNLHALHMERIAILRAELDKDPSPEERLRLLEEVRDVNDNALSLNERNQRFLSEQLEKKLKAAAAATLAVATVVAVAAKSGQKPLAIASKIFRS